MLPRLRMTLDFIPSPFEDKPGLVIRDPFHFSDATLIVPSPLIECLEFVDGGHNALDLRAHLVRITGDLHAVDLENNLLNALSAAGFLASLLPGLRAYRLSLSDGLNPRI